MVALFHHLGIEMVSFNTFEKTITFKRMLQAAAAWVDPEKPSVLTEMSTQLHTKASAYSGA